MSDIYTEIKNDHDNHRLLLDKLVQTEGDSPERARLFAELKEDVTAHADAEEQTFYAALIAKPDAQEQARHSVAEHKDAADLIEELEDTDFSSPGWLATARKLCDELKHHMDEEEEDVFELGRKLIPADEADKLGTDFRNRKKKELAA
ncbi:hemerythrin domain-containing protein [Pyruvatibacter mobilis]|uniref:hemerythrin domain-containing protein n=1 Tax=Pyruvatibacter mobilis TaxID=1712261 RepID=UPI003BB0C156